jgi:type VI protein secretion system component VasK
MIESADRCVLLRTSEDIEMYQKAANDSATEETWHEVIDKYPDMKVWVARNKTVPLSILEILSHDESVDVRYAVAMKRKSSQDILQRLAKDPDDSIRLRIALNPKTSRTILEQLLDDEWSRVVEEARNRLEEDLLLKML